MIVIGNEALFRQAGLTMPANLGNSGYYIVARGNSIFIMGETEYGLRNGVYAFLYYTIGMETFSEDTVIYNCGKTVAFPYNLEVIGKADIEMALPSNRLDDEKTVHAMGLLTKSDVFALTEINNYTNAADLIMFGNYWHNSFNYLPYEGHMDENAEGAHRSWFSTSAYQDKDGNWIPFQICYTARGNESEYKLMIDTVYAKMQEFLRQSPNATTITFTIQDNEEICHCTECERIKEKYGSNSAAVIHFINDLADKLAVDHPNVRLLFFAYNMTEEPPQIVDDYTRCRDNVAVFYAPIRANYSVSFSDPLNQTTADRIQKWSEFSENIYLWLYNTNFNYYLFPHNSFEAMAEINKFCAQYNVKFIYWEGQWEQTAQTAFSTLKEYMNACLAWNADYTAEELYNKFFPAYFGGASATMRTYFDELVKHMKEHPAGNSGSISESIATKEIWDKETLERWLGYINTAYTQVDENSVYYKHIKLESIFIRHALAALYSENPDDPYANDPTFKEDCRELGVERYSECNKDVLGYTCGDYTFPNGINW